MTTHLIDMSGNTLPCGYRPVVGESSSSSTEIEEVDCIDCLAIHDEVTGE